MVVVLSALEQRAVVELAAEVRPWVDVDVAVGDPDQARRPDRRRAAGVQRRELVVDRDLHLGLAVVAQLDALDLARGRAPDADEVARDELAGVLEHEAVRVRVVAREDDHEERGEAGEQRA